MYPNLKLQIFKLGIRQNQIAKDLKFCESQLSKIIHGYREPSVGERKLLAVYLNVDETWLFERHENISTPQAAMFAAIRGEIRMAAVKSQTITVDLETPAATIRDFDTGTSLAWDSFIATHQEATPFHSTAWMRALQTTFHYENRSLYAQTGGKITGVLPLFLVSNWVMGRCLISSPFADYGGVCAVDERSAEGLIARAHEIAKAEKVDFMELRSKSSKPQPGFYPRDLYVSFETELCADPEVQLKQLPRDTRYMIRKASKAGLEVRSGIDQLPEFYELFAVSWHRLGTPVPSRQWLETLVEEFRETSDLTMVILNGRPLAGVLSFIFRDTIFPHYAGASPAANDVAANNLMYWELMRKAIDRGISRFDFGRSKKKTGAYQFKSAWNMAITPLQYQVCLVKRQTPPNFSPSNPKFALAAKLWSRLPLQASTWLGPRVVSWFP